MTTLYIHVDAYDIGVPFELRQSPFIMLNDKGGTLAVIEGLAAGGIQVETEFRKGFGNDEILVFEVWIDGLEG